jgi:hypothetical protein
VRNLTVDQTDGEAFASITFFASYIVLVGIVLMQVVIAVLLEQFSLIRSNRLEDSFAKPFDCNPCPFGAYMRHLAFACDKEHFEVMCKNIFRAVVIAAGAQTKGHASASDAVEDVRLDYSMLHRGASALPVRRRDHVICCVCALRKKYGSFFCVCVCVSHGILLRHVWCGTGEITLSRFLSKSHIRLASLRGFRLGLLRCASIVHFFVHFSEIGLCFREVCALCVSAVCRSTLRVCSKQSTGRVSCCNAGLLTTTDA